MEANALHLLPSVLNGASSSSNSSSLLGPSLRVEILEPHPDTASESALSQVLS